MSIDVASGNGRTTKRTGVFRRIGRSRWLRERRSFLDYHRYLARVQRGEMRKLLWLFGAVLVAAGIFYTKAFGGAGSFAILVISVGVLGSRLFSFWKELRSYLHITNTVVTRAEVQLKDVLPSEEEVDAGFRSLPVVSEVDGKVLTEFVFHSNSLDKFLWSAEKIQTRETGLKPTRVRKFITKNRSALLKMLAYKYRTSLSKHGLFNENKLCLSRVIYPKEFVNSNINKSQGQIEIHRGTYFDSLLTNEACTQKLKYRGSDGVVEEDFTRFFPKVSRGSNAHLVDIAHNAMNDHIGVSTLGFTLDRHLVVWEQHRYLEQSPNLLAPTGSGSCDWDDLDREDFMKTLCTAMERELCEESGLGIDPEQIEKTRVLGFFRWIRRGGKPEFVGVTRLNVRSDQLEPDDVETKKPDYKPHTFRVADITALPEVLDEIRGYGNLSVPLAVNLNCLQQFYECESAILEDFLWGPISVSSRPASAEV